MGSTVLIRFYIYFQFSCDHICYRKGKKIENFQFLMLKFKISVSNLYMTGLGKFNISIHCFFVHIKWLCAQVRATKLRMHKTVTVGINLHSLIYNLLIIIIFPIEFASVNCKKYQLRMLSS